MTSKEPLTFVKVTKREAVDNFLYLRTIFQRDGALDTMLFFIYLESEEKFVQIWSLSFKLKYVFMRPVSYETMIILYQMHWAEPVETIKDDRLPKQLFIGKLKIGMHLKRKPGKSLKDNLKENLKALHMDELSKVEFSRTE